MGKTTAVNLFAGRYKQYIRLNLERNEDAAVFQNFQRFDTLVESIFFLKNENIAERDTLLFIDEIQEVPEAVNLLRYFYEDYPHLHVIAAGSILETVLREKVSVPVGRIEYRVVRPAAFSEFLDAMGEQAALQQYNTVPLADYAHETLLHLFHKYALIGGMPEVVRHYAENRSLTALLTIYESLIVAYLNDVDKYAKNSAMVQVMRHVISSMWAEAGNRIKFQGFGKSNYGSREAGEALRAIEKAMLLQLVYPCTSAVLPLLPNKKKSPRLHLLDTGLMNHFAGLQKSIVNAGDLTNLYQGKIAEHITGQEMLAAKFNVLNELHFWTREKKDATAEVDFIYPWNGLIIPVEVKSGAGGHLRSLHQFMDAAPHALAIRLYAGKLKKDELKTPSGKRFTLLNLPYFLAGKLEAYLEWVGK